MFITFFFRKNRLVSFLIQKGHPIKGNCLKENPARLASFCPLSFWLLRECQFFFFRSILWWRSGLNQHEVTTSSVPNSFIFMFVYIIYIIPKRTPQIIRKTSLQISLNPPTKVLCCHGKMAAFRRPLSAVLVAVPCLNR